MIKFFKKNWFLILILLLAAFLRLYRLGSDPPSMHWDETAIGYNAYSILKTGRDEYGKLLPLIFKSFGDYKPGLYIYLAVPPIALFGLNEFAVRLPSAMIGVLTVWLTFQFVLLLFKKKQPALWSSFALAISPWHLQFSRGAWEANLALFLALAGVFGFLKAEKKKIGWLYLSVILFGIALFAYQSSKMFIPLIILGLMMCFWKKIKTLPLKHLFISAAIILTMAVPIYLSVFSGAGGRLKVMSIFSYPRNEGEIKQILKEDNNNKFFFSLFHTEPLAISRGILERYFNHFSGRFLFFEGDWSNARHNVPYAGVCYYFDLFFLLAGVYWLIRQNSAGSKFIWLWLLISPLPAALSRDQIQAVRALNMVLPLMVIIGCGMYQVYLWLKNQRKYIFILCSLFFVLFYLWNFAYYLDQYYIHYPRQSSQYWQYGYKQLINKISPIKNNYERIIFTSDYGQSYIYWLFYTKYSPLNYQGQAKLTENPWGDVGRIEKLDNIEFREIYWPSDRSLAKSLFIGTEEQLPLKDIDPNQARILEEIKFLNGQIAFRVVETL
ncbi:glycosyltransferase family 39 protein [Patescibacteria group bacterium]|nr:glycosyltransferase family 39 protein [Patescibacteria group bacterium]